MQHVEALREVKRAEAEVRSLKEEAARKAQTELREAERKATELVEAAKRDAESSFDAGVKKAHEDVSKDRQKILKAGEADAQGVRAKLSSPAFNQAVDAILRNFEKRVSGK